MTNSVLKLDFMSIKLPPAYAARACADASRRAERAFPLYFGYSHAVIDM
jgi:hypothetical protein